MKRFIPSLAAFILVLSAASCSLDSLMDDDSYASNDPDRVPAELVLDAPPEGVQLFLDGVQVDFPVDSYTRTFTFRDDEWHDFTITYLSADPQKSYVFLVYEGNMWDLEETVRVRELNVTLRHTRLTVSLTQGT